MGNTAEATATACTKSSVTAESCRRSNGAIRKSSRVRWSAKGGIPMTVLSSGWPWAMSHCVW